VKLTINEGKVEHRARGFLTVRLHVICNARYLRGLFLSVHLSNMWIVRHKSHSNKRTPFHSITSLHPASRLATIHPCDQPPTNNAK